MKRRGFLTLLTGVIAAPAIIKVAGIMPVKVPKPDFTVEAGLYTLPEDLTAEQIRAMIEDIHKFVAETNRHLLQARQLRIT